MLKRLLAILILITAIIAGAAVTASTAPNFVWIEAESMTNSASLKTQDGAPEVISGGKWVAELLDSKDAVTSTLKAARSLKADFEVIEEGTYKLWMHVGYDFGRPDIKWRIDDGELQTIKSTDVTSNLLIVDKELGPVVSWAVGGDVTLTAGKHTIEVIADKENTTTNKFLFAVDAIAMARGDWTPDATLKPGEKPESDADIKAQDKVYSFSDTNVAAGLRLTLPLNDLWQVARHDDPDMDKNTYEPMKEADLPSANAVWRGIKVPSDLRSIKTLNGAHRVWYRTKVDVPAEMSGKSFILDFEGTNWIASVVINGKYVDYRKSTSLPWQCDITDFVKPGEVNEIMVGIKGPWYAFDAAHAGVTLDELRGTLSTEATLKTQYYVGPIYPSTKGDTDGTRVGMTNPVSLIVANGQPYVSDVFVKTTVTDNDFKQNNKTITADITLTNPSDKDVEVSVSADAIYNKDSKVEKQLAAKTVTVPANGSKLVTLTDKWDNVKLWFPEKDMGHMYTLRVNVKAGDNTSDIYDQKFGFREVKIDGKYIRINGLRRNFWNLVDALSSGATLEKRLEHFYAGNNNFERFGADLGLESLLGGRKHQLDWTDENGIGGRLSTMIDGMFITHDLRNDIVWENYKEHIEQVVKAYRNHPSVIVYSLENEMMFIEAALGFRSSIDDIEKKAKSHMMDVAHNLDPTRPNMFDGGGAFQDSSADIFCHHYMEDFQPDIAAPLNKLKSHGLWQWDGKKPFAAGEIAYMSGNNGDHAWIGGESSTLGKSEAQQAYAKYIRHLFERYRWNDAAMIFPWTGQNNLEEAINAMSPIAAFVRQYNSNFYSESTVTRTVKVFNDTFNTKPLTFKWTVEANGKVVKTESKEYTIEPGFNKEVTISFKAPKVTSRTAATLTLEVTQEGTKSYKDVKELAFMPKVTSVKLTRTVYTLGTSKAVSDKLKVWKIKATAIKKVSYAKKKDGIIIVAPDFLKDEDPILPSLVNYSKNGGRVIFLEQKNPVYGDALPSKLMLAADSNGNTQSSYFNFGQGFDRPLMKGLAQKDLSNWAAGGSTAKEVWVKPSGAIRSWITNGPNLGRSSLIELANEKGLILASQMKIGANLGKDPAAETLLKNLLLYSNSFKVSTALTSVYAPDRPDIVKAIRAMGIRIKTPSTLVSALDFKASPITVVSASKANLDLLVQNKTKVDKYVSDGGWIMMWGLTPDALETYNSILGTKHALREFRKETVRLAGNSMTMGLDGNDVSLFTNEVIAPWMGLKSVSPDVYTYVVDSTDDVAPFNLFPARGNSYDANPMNMADGLLNADFWHYCYQWWYDGVNALPKEIYNFKTMQPSKINTLKIWNNANYDTIKDLEIYVDGKLHKTVELPDSFDMTLVDMGGVEVTQSISLKAKTMRVYNKNGMPLAGIDEVKFIRELPEWYAAANVAPLDTNGGLVKYSRGKGGFVLNQIKLMSNDTVSNTEKKNRIVSVLLQNMGASFIK